MRRRIALLVALLTGPATNVSVEGQDRLPTTLFSQCRAIRLEIVLGRVAVMPRHRGQLRGATHPDDPSPIRELLVVNNDSASPLVRYERVSPGESVLVEIVGQRQITIRRVAEDDQQGMSFEYVQPAQGDVRLVVLQGAQTRELATASLWHLLMTERELCAETLVAELELLRPDWQLVTLAERLEIALFHRAQSERPLARRELEQLVADLNAAQFQQRQRADGQLRDLGPSVLPYLENLTRQQELHGRRLTSEQRDRLQRMRLSLSTGTADTPERVAQWLVNDAQAWLALLKHQDPERRHLASLRLAALRPDAILFDAYGDETYRQEQLAQLQLQLLR